MRFQFGGGVLAVFIALALQVDGVADFHLAPVVVGGLDGCTHSDKQEFDCVEINDNQLNCGKIDIVNPTIQICRDFKSTSTVICTGNDCQNTTQNVATAAGADVACKKINCGE